MSRLPRKPRRIDFGYKLQNELADAIAEVRDKTWLPRTHELVLLHLARQANWHTGLIKVGTRRLAMLLRMSRTDLLSYLDQLVDQRVVEVVEESRQHESRTLRLHPEAIRRRASDPSDARRARMEMRAQRQGAAVRPTRTAQDVAAVRPTRTAGIAGVDGQRSESRNPAVRESPFSGPSQSDQIESKYESVSNGELSIESSPLSPLRSLGGAGDRDVPVTEDDVTPNPEQTLTGYAEFLIAEEGVSDRATLIQLLRTSPAAARVATSVVARVADDCFMPIGGDDDD